MRVDDFWKHCEKEEIKLAFSPLANYFNYTFINREICPCFYPSCLQPIFRRLEMMILSLHGNSIKEPVLETNYKLAFLNMTESFNKPG